MYKFAGQDMESPLINAAGSISGTNPETILREVGLLADTAIGAITFGSVTIPAQAGNEAQYGGPVYIHDKETRTTYNSIGLGNIGLKGAKELLPQIVEIAHAKGKPVIVSVSPTHPNEKIGNAIEQSVTLFKELRPLADLVEINTSCPNIVTEGGGRKPILGYDLEAMEELVEALWTYTGTVESQAGVKVPPYMNGQQKATVHKLAKLFKQRGLFSFLTTSNTIPGGKPPDNQPQLSVPGGKGGMSGPATAKVGREQLRLWRKHLGAKSEIDIVSNLGVYNGRELAKRRELGAVAAGGVTFLWESDDWGRAVSDMLTDWAHIEQSQN